MIAPLSIGRVLVVVECLNIDACMRPDIAKGVSELLDLKHGSRFDEWEDFLDFGFVLVEDEVTDANVAEGHLMIDYLRNDKYREFIQADLFVDGTHVASSWEDGPDLWTEDAADKPNKSVVLRFPIEKIRRHHDSGKKP